MADELTAKNEDTALLNALLAFVREHTNPKLDRFREPVASWGDTWCGVQPVWLPAAARLAGLIASASPQTLSLLSVFAEHSRALHWEQAYSTSDSEVEPHMLENYGYAEIIGKQGPFISECVRAGIAVYGPGINYPPHRHQAEEVYAVLAGQASFLLGASGLKPRYPGEVIYHPADVPHGLYTGEHTVCIFYAWRGGDLREKPTFTSST